MNNTNLSRFDDNVQFNSDAVEETVREGSSKIIKNQFIFSEEAKKLAAEYVRIFTVEAIKRSLQEARNKQAAFERYGIRTDNDEEDDNFENDATVVANSRPDTHASINARVEVTHEHLETIAAQLFFEFK